MRTAKLRWRRSLWLVAALLTSCTENPPRPDLPPPSRAAQFTVAITLEGRVDMLLPPGVGAGLVGGALAGGYEACLLTAGLGCVAAPVFMPDRKSTRLNSSHIQKSRMPSSA